VAPCIFCCVHKHHDFLDIELPEKLKKGTELQIHINHHNYYIISALEYSKVFVESSLDD